MALPEASFIWGANGAKLTPEEIAMQRAILARKGGIDTSPIGHWAQGAARVADAISGAFQRGRLDTAAEENTAYDASLASPLAEALAGGVAAYPSSVAAGGGSMAPAAVGEVNVAPEIKEGIAQTASSLGIDPVDLATAISYETGGTFDPTKAGPTTQWGQHRGLIQFGEPQAKQYGVDWSNPVGSQLGPDGAVAKYLRGAGVKPGMGMLDIYSAINAGAPGRYNASDANNGGAPGTVADKVNSQMAGHRAKAMALFGGGQAAAPVQVASLEPSAGMAAYAPEAAVAPPAAAAIEAVAPQGQIGIPMPGEPGSGLTPEQAAQLQVAADPTGQTTVASAMQAPVQAGAPMATPPADVSRVPALSAANGLPVVGPTGEPSSPISGQARVAAALQAYPIQQQAAAGDQMVAGADQTLQPTTMATPNAKGLLEPGNIDLASRPVVKNADGSISTVRSMSFNEDGKEILIPTVSPDGRILSNDEAVNLYHQTGQNLGKFNSPQAATEYAQTLHNQQSQAYAPQQQPNAAGGGQAQAPQSNPIAAAVRALSDPRASPQTKAIAELVIKQAQARQAAQAEQQVWQQRQAYEQQQKQNDPTYQADLRLKQAQVADIGKVKPTADIQEYEMYSAQEKAAGRQPLSLLQYQQELKKAGASNTTVSVGGNNSKFIEESDKAAATRLGTIVEQGNAAPQFMADLNRLTELGAQIGTGKGAQVLQAVGPYAQALGIDIKGLDEGQAYQAIVDRLAPNMRPAGAGATSDFDARQYLSSLPSMARTPGGNAIVAQTLQALQENKIKAAEWASKAQSQEITWQEAEKQIRSMADPYMAFKKFKADLDDPKKVPTAVPGVTIRKIGD